MSHQHILVYNDFVSCPFLCDHHTSTLKLTPLQLPNFSVVVPLNPNNYYHSV